MIRTLCKLATAAALLAALMPARAADLSFDPALATSPPEVRQATIELLAKPVAAGNAVLRVRFTNLKRDKPLPIQGAAGPVPLRDDGVAPDAKAGDGIFSAWVQIDPDAYAKEQQRRLGLAKQYTTLPRFDMRELLGYWPFRPTDVTLKPGVATTLDDFRGVPYVVDSARTLMIRDPLVVDDPARTYDACSGAGTPMGAWTFGRLMTEIANQPVTGIDPSDFVEHWVSQWKVDQTINTYLAWKRTRGAQDVLDQWPKLPSGKLDLAQAPFRLLAIVNRQDLRGNVAYGGGNAGEARLVFGLLHCHDLPDDHWPGFASGEVQQMTVIFEYGVPRSGCVPVRDWAAQWKNLGALALGSAAYNTALQAITDQFTLRDADPSKPNRSAINQVRSNEFALNDPPIDAMWELRESRLVRRGLDAGQLNHATAAQTPHFDFRGIAWKSDVLRDYINATSGSILAGTHEVPLRYPLVGGTPILTGSPTPGAGVAWNPAGVLNLEARHRFSLATCDGCHTLETDTRFTHVKPRAPGVAAGLSDFLTGANMPKHDPVTGVNRTFHELLDRQAKLDATASMGCFKAPDLPLSELFFRPLAPAFRH